MPLVRGGVADVHGLEVEVREDPADVRMIVDADHNLAFAATHEVSHPFVILERKIHPIASGLPVGRVHVVKGMGTVVAFGAFKPG